ncbi:unnamed protein product [Ectocarpus sp. CCAP 1310/34]|nr:unnamed protein product [Ectocarpus sp. CCAP 1310/34]
MSFQLYALSRWRASGQAWLNAVYRLEVTADLGGVTTRWRTDCIKYPKSNKKARDWAAEAALAAVWRPSHCDRYATLSKDTSKFGPAPPRFKRPRDCCPATHHLQSVLHLQGHEMMATYKARVEQGQLEFADMHVRDLSTAMLNAAVEVDKHEYVWRTAFLKRQSNRGVRRAEALRKLAKHRSQLEKAALAATACKAGWEKGVEYFRAVVKECQLPRGVQRRAYGRRGGRCAREMQVAP